MSSNTLYRVSDADRSAYLADGVVCLRGVVPTPDCAAMLHASLQFMQAGQGRISEAQIAPGVPRFFSATYMSRTVPEFRNFSIKSTLPAVAAALIDSDTLRFFYDQLFIKEGGSTAPTPWHNDLPFWPLRGSDIVSLWVALTAVSTETSGLEYLAGSHRSGTMYQAIGVSGNDRLKDPALRPSPDYNIAANRGSGRFLSWDLEPGDVLCHHPLTLHGAGGNRNRGALRVGLSERYLGQDVQWDPRPYTIKLPHEPAVEPGSYPADDEAFPWIAI